MVTTTAAAAMAPVGSSNWEAPENRPSAAGTGRAALVDVSEIPWEMEQAAQVDGATTWQAFRKVIVPLASPGVFTTAIIAFFIAWNDFAYGISLTSTSRARPVPAALGLFSGASQFEDPTGAIAAAAVIVTIPVVVLVLLFQRRIVAGLTNGAVKG